VPRPRPEETGEFAMIALASITAVISNRNW
jgi:hypothetical protein